MQKTSGTPRSTWLGTPQLKLHAVCSPNARTHLTAALPYPAPASDWPTVVQVRDALVSERRRLMGLLQQVPFLEPYPSHANFILCKVTQGRDAKAVKDALAQKVIGMRAPAACRAQERSLGFQGLVSGRADCHRVKCCC